MFMLNFDVKSLECIFGFIVIIGNLSMFWSYGSVNIGGEVIICNIL